MIENWIDALAAVWEISDGRGGTVRSYRVFSKDEFPEDLSDFPCAISYPTGMQAVYGQTSYTLTHGVTEFHIVPNVAKVNFPALLPYFRRILVAAAANLTLGGLVTQMILDQDQINIEGPVELTYGDQAPNHGFLVRWIVKENEAVTIGG